MKHWRWFIGGICFFAAVSVCAATFNMLDSQQMSGGVASSSSSHFHLLGSIGDFAIGGSSAADFALKSGFLYFPQVIAPALTTATPGDAQVTLIWTAAQAFQGLSVGGYNVCTKTTGAYTCTNVGLVTTYPKTSLSNGTAYTFEIEAKDARGNIIAVSNEMSATPVAPPTPTPTPTPPPAGGGGGGGPPPSSGTGTIIIRGIAYASSTVSVSLDGVSVSSVRAGSNASFEVTLTGIAAGAHTVGLSSEDDNGRKSITSTYSMTLSSGVTTTLTDVFLAPTIDISATQVGVGDSVKIFGQTAPSSAVDVHVQSNDIVTPTIANTEGEYAITFSTKPLAADTHITKSRATFNMLVSPFSQVLSFVVGKGAGMCGKSGDLNHDCKVNIVDFSILMFWWNTKQAKGLGIADINHDNKVDIIDFSIMLYNWGG